jgi:hypothetical protein
MTTSTRKLSIVPVNKLVALITMQARASKVFLLDTVSLILPAKIPITEYDKVKAAPERSP